MANIILYGGSFDPIHNGHLRIANYASLKLNADVIFVPAKTPRWKEVSANEKHRLKMLKLVLKGCAPSGSRISKFEIESDAEVNYSIDTVRYYKNKYKKANLYFLIGGDQVNRFDKWKEAEEIAKLAHIVFVPRPGIILDNKIIKKYNMTNLEYFESGEVSSSEIRAGRFLDLPWEAINYIEKKRLYYIATLEKYVSEQRLLHSMEVAKLAYKIAKINKLDNPWKFYIAGLFHDIGKLSGEHQLDANEFMEKNYPEYMNLPKFAYHQFIGAYIAEHEIGINDSDILDAIKFHCTGKANMSKLGMVVYASDKIEPTRPFDSRFLINSCYKNWYQGFIDTLVDNKKYLLAHAKDIQNKLTDECFKMYIGD